MNCPKCGSDTNIEIDVTHTLILPTDRWIDGRNRAQMLAIAQKEGFNAWDVCRKCGHKEPAK